MTDEQPEEELLIKDLEIDLIKCNSKISILNKKREMIPLLIWCFETQKKRILERLKTLEGGKNAVFRKTKN